MSSYPKKLCDKCGVSSRTNQPLCKNCRKVCPLCNQSKSFRSKQCKQCYSIAQSQQPNLYAQLHTKESRDKAAKNLNDYFQQNKQREILSCLNCKKEFQGRKNQTYCSLKCAATINGKSKRNQRNTTCQVCGELFKSPNYREAKYCSKACWGNRNPPVEKICIICSISFETYDKSQKTCSKDCGHKWRSTFLRGEKAPAWKDGKSLERERLRLGTEVKEWRFSVFSRDGFKCQECEATKDLHAHHIKEWAKFPDLRFDVANGITLCIDCHGKVHNKDFRKRVSKNTTCPICKGTMAGRGKTCRKCMHKSRQKTNQDAQSELALFPSS